MHPSGNTILITGGGSGIGRGLAEAFHALGNQIIVSGRRRYALDEILKNRPTPPEVCVENVKGFRFAAENGNFDTLFSRLNAS